MKAFPSEIRHFNYKYIRTFEIYSKLYVFGSNDPLVNAIRARPRRTEPKAVVAIADPQNVGNLFGRPKARASRRWHV